MLNKLNKRRGGFTLVEIMIVVAIIALLAAIAVPGFLRARKRSQASKVLNDLRLIDSAVDQYAIENNKKANAAVTVAAWTQYMKGGTTLYSTGEHPVYGTVWCADGGRAASRADRRLQRSVGRGSILVLGALLPVRLAVHTPVTSAACGSDR